MVQRFQKCWKLTKFYTIITRNHLLYLNNIVQICITTLLANFNERKQLDFYKFVILRYVNCYLWKISRVEFEPAIILDCY